MNYLTAETILVYTILAGLLSIIYAYLISKQILSANPGNKKMQEVANAIQIGAKAYLNRQYKTHRPRTLIKQRDNQKYKPLTSRLAVRPVRTQYETHLTQYLGWQRKKPQAKRLKQ